MRLPIVYVELGPVFEVSREVGGRFGFDHRVVLFDALVAVVAIFIQDRDVLVCVVECHQIVVVVLMMY